MEKAPLTTILALILLTTPAQAAGPSATSTDDQPAVWAPAGQLVPDNPTGKIGTAVEVSGDLALVSVRGHAEVFERAGSSWIHSAILPPGGPVRSLSLDGNTAVLGAAGAEAAYVYTEDAEDWTRSATLSTPPSVEEGSMFGWSVAVDGDRIAVAALTADEPTVYIYEESPGGWAMTGNVTSPLGPDGRGDWFGWSLDLSGDRLVVAELKTNAAHVYERNATGWNHTSILDAGSPGNTGFGRSVAIDGGVVAVGASGITAAFVFEQRDGTWVPTATIEGQDLHPEDRNRRFGFDVDVDGERVLVGAPVDDGAPGLADSPIQASVPCLPAAVATTCDGPGAAYVFAKQGDGGWQQMAKLGPETPLPREGFGEAVALDGGSAIVGSPDRLARASGFPGGSAYAFLDLASLGPQEGSL